MMASICGHRKMMYSALLLVLLSLVQNVAGLKCFVGLGNTSAKLKMKVMECPEGKHYVCVKMFGGGMGDQIRRYCDSISKDAYRDLLETEDLKKTEYPSEDPACYDHVHNGRDVKVCICSGDKCNGSSSLSCHGFWMSLVAAILCLRHN